MLKPEPVRLTESTITTTDVTPTQTIEEIKVRLERPVKTTDDDDIQECEEDNIKQPAIPPTLNLSVGSTPGLTRVARINSTEDTIELWDENDSGLSWGEKRGRNGQWEERWLQQKTIKREPGASTGETIEVDVTFGRSTGVNAEFHQKWAASWETRSYPLNKEEEEEKKNEKTQEIDDDSESLGPVLSSSSSRRVTTLVKKSVRQYDNRMKEVIEEWDEVIKEERRPENCSVGNEELTGWTRRQQTQKIGRDKKTGRQWTDTREEIYEGENNEPTIVTEEFEETLGFTTRTRKFKRDRDGREYNFINMQSEDQGKKVCLVEESNENPNGLSCGEKSGTTADGSQWKSKWYFKPDGTKESIEWSSSPEGLIREEKTETKVNGERHGTREERSIVSCDGRTEQHCFIDEWWAKPSGDTWGEKELKKEIYTEDEDGNKILISSNTVNEKWYDNTSEKVIDNWKTNNEYENGVIVTKTEHGYKLGNRYSDGTEWGERWNRVSERASVVPTSERNISVTTNEETLHLRIREHDRWWKEPHGNRWGEKRYVDLKEGVESNENWYDNGEEEQVDRWQINNNGERSGEKFGRRRTGGRCEWNEKWGKGPSQDSGNFWIDKYWKEYTENGKCLKWGETEGREGGKQWKQKWGEDQDQFTNTGHRWIEKWADDGFGNLQTHKEGSDWVGGQTVAWFSDKYGECLGQEEKWAVKEGGNVQGDKWVEKWNETPHEKSAEKIGSNRQGDEWRESWNEKLIDNNHIKWAEKTGKNVQGEEWMETWLEENDNKKTAKKTGKNLSEEWTEQWGEDIGPDGSGQKWTLKWAKDCSTGSSHGQSWGDKWGAEGAGGHRWGEKWNNGAVDKWWHDTTGRPAGC